VMTATLQKQSHARNPCKLPQYQSFKINTKFIRLILPKSSLGFVSWNNRRSTDVRSE
jgi:hypothetical protein